MFPKYVDYFSSKHEQSKGDKKTRTEQVKLKRNRYSITVVKKLL